MHTIYANKIKLSIQKTDVCTKKVDGYVLAIFDIIIEVFLINNKDKKIRFFEKIFLLTNINLDVIFKMLFFTLNNTNIRFLE